MGFKRLLYSDVGVYMISIILGLGLSTLFRKACNERSCLVFHAPPLKELQKETYRYDGKCYKYKTNTSKCEKSKTDVSIGNK